MVVLFLPDQLNVAARQRRDAGRCSAQHLVGVQLDPSLAVVASVVDQQQQRQPAQLPVEVLQTILDGINLPRGWPEAAALRVLGQVRARELPCPDALRAGAAGTTDPPRTTGTRAAPKGIQLFASLDVSPQSVHSVVLFTPPNPSRHHFLALDPIKLHFATERPVAPTRDVVPGTTSGSVGTTVLPVAVDLINLSHQIDILVQEAVRSRLDSTASTEAHPSTERGPRGSRVRASVQRSVGFVGAGLLAIFDSVPAPGLPPLKDVSALFNQLSIRTHQAVVLSLQLPSLRRSIPIPREMASARADYIGFYNVVWLVLNDLIVGQALGRLVAVNEALIARWLVWSIKTLTVDGPLDLLVWLNHWPAGLKLNTELSAFASSTLSSLVQFWDSAVLRHLTASLPTILWLVSLSGFLGASALIALASDLLSLATTHLYAAYLASTVTYRWMATLLGGLFDVFRGKRRNVLRQRLDSTTYTVDQLLVGSVLFTTLVFLFPTVLAYYSLIAFARTGVIFAHAALETALACVNHYPLFAIMLRIKSPSRLPGGVHLQPTDEPGVLRLRNKPLAMSALLKQHFLLAARILSVHYSPLRLARAFVKGEIVTPLSSSGGLDDA